MTKSGVVVSVIIKALNEEKNIERAIRSSIGAIDGFVGEVILADSNSTDATVEIAARYDIKIVQLRNDGERCCGVGPQLGYQAATGKYIYLLDGDMELDPCFIKNGIKILESDGLLAGVAGEMTLVGGESYEFKSRKEQGSIYTKEGIQPWLVCGGLYRRSAIEDAGYFSNRNLHSHEEQELGRRLTEKGWKLARLNIPALKHYVHNDNTLGLIVKRWRSRYINGPGELIRASFRKPYFYSVIAYFWKYELVVLYWLSLLFSLFFSLCFAIAKIISGLLLFVLLLYVIFNKNGPMQGFHSVLTITAQSMGLLRGLFNRQKSPYQRIECVVIKG